MSLAPKRRSATMKTEWELRLDDLNRIGITDKLICKEAERGCGWIAKKRSGRAVATPAFLSRLDAAIRRITIAKGQ